MSGEGPNWPGNDDYRQSPYSVMAYYAYYTEGQANTLQQADIAALQFLYGAPGADDEGVESLLADII